MILVPNKCLHLANISLKYFVIQITTLHLINFFYCIPKFPLIPSQNYNTLKFNLIKFH